MTVYSFVGSLLLLLPMLLLLLQLPSVALAQEEEDCTAATSCEECLGVYSCVWNNDGTCMEGCGNFPNVDCYFARMFGGNNNVASMCAVAAERRSDQEFCFSKTDSISCLQQPDCGWFTGNVAATGTRGGWCALDLTLAFQAPRCTAATTCGDCLADETCVWKATPEPTTTTTDGGNNETSSSSPSTSSSSSFSCVTSCDNFPNVDCYYPRLFGTLQDSRPAICRVANESVAEQQSCFNQTSQESCFGLNAGCSWVSGAAATEGTNGWCVLYLDLAAAGTSSAAAAASVKVLGYYYSLLWLGVMVVIVSVTLLLV